MGIFVISLLTFGAILGGGGFALRYQGKLALIIGFSAGLRLGAAFFNLIPESMELVGRSISLESLMLALTGGFLLLYVLERFTIMHVCQDGACEYGRHQDIGILGAAGLSLHTLLDGMAIGMGFQASYNLGMIIAAAVLFHAFSDGFSLVGVMLANKNTTASTLRMLMVQAVAPVVGIGLATFLAVPAAVLGLSLAFFAGFFIYLGASDLLPEAHREDTSWVVMTTTLLGFVFIFSVRNLITKI